MICDIVRAEIYADLEAEGYNLTHSCTYKISVMYEYGLLCYISVEPESIVIAPCGWTHMSIEGTTKSQITIDYNNPKFMEEIKTILVKLTAKLTLWNKQRDLWSASWKCMKV